MKEPAHLARHRFGQIPTYDEGDLVVFETGSIVFHLAHQHDGLLPKDADARARTITWMFAALNTVEPPILDLTIARILRAVSNGRRNACRWSWTVPVSGLGNCLLA